MLCRLAYRAVTELSPRLAMKAGWLWVYKGMRAVGAYKRRVKRGELFPPFFFLALTNACNLRCHGCWIEGHGRVSQLSVADVDALIAAGKRQRAYFYTLLGGEPMIYPGLWEIIERHRDCYFQIITNGMFFSEENVARLRAAGNVTPLVSIDGLEAHNDDRRGAGVFQAAMDGLARLKKNKMLFGVATTVTGRNLDEVLTDEYVREMIGRGAMYLWYYVYRPVGADPSPHYCVGREQMIELRRRLLQLRRKHPIIIIDTYWNAAGEAVCPAALGLGFHIGPQGSIEPCPPLSFAGSDDPRQRRRPVHHDQREPVPPRVSGVRQRADPRLRDPRTAAGTRRVSPPRVGRRLQRPRRARGAFRRHPAEQPPPARRRNPRRLLGLSDAEEAAFLWDGRVWVAE